MRLLGRGGALLLAGSGLVLSGVLAGSTTYLAAAQAPVGTATPTAAPVPSPTPSATLSPSVTPSATPSTSDTPSPSPSPTTTTTTPAVVDPYPVELLTEAQKVELGACLQKSVSPGTGGTCAKLAMKKLAAAGFLKSAPVSVNLAGANAVLNYQRSRGIKANAVISTQTWVALATAAPEIPEVIPADCLTPGVVLCVDKAHRKLKYIKNGTVVKTIAIRVGGWNNHPKRPSDWRVYPTTSGTWKVYDKQVSPASENYGAGAMPYAVMFYPDMYVHYSSGFAHDGYTKASHGCVNVGSLADAKWFFANTPIGAKVFVFGG